MTQTKAMLDARNRILEERIKTLEAKSTLARAEAMGKAWDAMKVTRRIVIYATLIFALWAGVETMALLRERIIDPDGAWKVFTVIGTWITGTFAFYGNNRTKE